MMMTMVVPAVAIVIMYEYVHKYVSAYARARARVCNLIGNEVKKEQFLLW
jgi:hypothetical protein